MKVKFIKFNDKPWDPQSKNYQPELIEVIATVLTSPFFWIPIILWVR